MSRENVEVIRRGYDAWNREDFEGVLEVLDPDIEWKLPEAGLNAGPIHGHGGVRKFLESYSEAFDVQVEPERFFEAPDRLVVFLRVSGRGRGSGAEVKVRPAHVWTMRAGKAVRIEVFTERERQKALEAVGLSE